MIRMRGCKICGLPITSNMAIAKYCSYHQYGQNKNVTDSKEVKKILLDLQKHKEASIKYDEFLKWSKSCFLNDNPGVFQELARYDYEIEKIHIQIQQLEYTEKDLRNQKNNYYNFEFKKYCSKKKLKMEYEE